jgi:ERCC4-type nuclease
MTQKQILSLLKKMTFQKSLSHDLKKMDIVISETIRLKKSKEIFNQTIIVDKREKNSLVIAELVNLGIEVKLENLEN